MEKKKIKLIPDYNPTASSVIVICVPSRHELNELAERELSDQEFDNTLTCIEESIRTQLNTYTFKICVLQVINEVEDNAHLREIGK